MRLLKEHTEAVTCVAFSPDGRWLATADAGGDVLLRDPLDLTVTRQAHPEKSARSPRPVSSVAFTIDGRHLVAAYRPSARRDARWVLGRWDLAGKERFDILARRLGPEPAVAISPDGRKLYAAHKTRTEYYSGFDLIEWSLPRWKRGHPRWLWATGPASERRCPAVLSANGPLILAGLRAAPDVSLMRDDLRLGARSWMAHPTAIRGLAGCPTGERFLTAGPNQVRLWRRLPETILTEHFDFYDHPEFLGEWRREGPAYIACLALSPDGRTAAVGRNGGLVNLLDVESMSATATFRWPIGNLTALAFAPDGLRLAAGGEGGSAVVWDVE